MKKNYDFSNSVPNPYAKHLRKQVTMRLGIDVIEYFKALAKETGVPYQNLINLYLRDCAHFRQKIVPQMGFLNKASSTQPIPPENLAS